MTTTALRSTDPTRQYFDRFFNDFFGDRFQAPGEAVSNNWVPAVDIRETETHLTVFVELPGLAKEDVDISLDTDVLTISGERKFDTGDANSYRRVERTYGKFSRSFRLPRQVQADKVVATFNAGVLSIELPKRDEAKSRKIQVA